MAEPPPLAVFDLDGTLVDTAEDLVATLNAIGAPHGLPPVSLADGRALVGHGARVMIERAFAQNGPALPQAELAALTRIFLAHYADHLVDHSRPFPGTEAALSELADAGWRLAVCTNKIEASSRRLLDLLGLAPYFAAIAGQDTFGVRKPDPRHLLETVRLAGGVPERAVMVGDSLTDVDTASAAAIPLVAVSFGYSAIPANELGATAVIDDYGALPALLAAIASAWEREVAGRAARR